MLPDFGWTELLVISIVLVVVIGPKDLPKVLRGFGKTMTSVRRMAGDFRKQFDDALKEAELDDVRSFADDVRSLDPRRQIRKALDPLAEAGKEIDADMKKAMGDTKLPELPKSPPQMGLEQSGEKARAAQSARRKAAATTDTRPGGESTETETPAKPARKAKGPAKKSKTAAAKEPSDEAPPPTAKARSRTARKTPAAMGDSGTSTSRAKADKPAATTRSAGATKPAKSGTRAQSAKANGTATGAKSGAKGGSARAKPAGASGRGSTTASRKSASGGSGSTRATRKPSKGTSASTTRRKTAKADAPASGGDNG
ncbi:Sec-independent protein translocase protein TatB [Roseitalea porphyridii]|uniref:Sec-independent protein translocase protein TatB n=1 Tax=Roseitalea porphyridii TaxID=1852022 RepID=UPI001FCE3091|nr:Sec-independent protein translocase protein TatB [Roseitalea porphyridii]